MAQHLRATLTAISLTLCALVWVRIVALPYALADARAYWSVNLDDLYAHVPHTFGAFQYSPAFAQLTHPITWLPWLAFYGLWVAVQIGILVWLVGPTLAALVLVVQPIGWGAISSGNLELPMAALIVLGFRYPSGWSFMLLTKVTPGIGLLWFAVRREWRSLGIALGTTALVALVSFALAPGQWLGWLAFLTADPGYTTSASLFPGPLWPRLLLAVVLIVWGARTDRRWVVPVAVVLTLAYAPWSQMLILAACWRLAPALHPKVEVGIGRERPRRPESIET